MINILIAVVVAFSISYAMIYLADKFLEGWDE